jgi:hypothetical protein
LKWAAPSGGDWVKITASTATSVSSHSITGCFSATYKVYKIYMNLTGAGADSVYWKGRVASTDTSVNYDVQLVTFAGATSFCTNLTAQTSAFAGDVKTNFSGAEFTIYDPFATASTPAHSLMTGDAQSGRYYVSRQTDSTSFDGITFLSSVNFSGTFYVYGLKA